MYTYKGCGSTANNTAKGKSAEPYRKVIVVIKLLSFGDLPIPQHISLARRIRIVFWSAYDQFKK